MDMNRILVKGAAIVTMDRNLGDLPRGDILVEGDSIAAVAPEIDASTAKAINAADMIVLPGLINGHLHTW
jgi:cytosine/adenosine deaminase-related metal-dependent hydrolase